MRTSIVLTKKQMNFCSQMTLEEKVGQMTQITLDAIGNGDSFLSRRFLLNLILHDFEKLLLNIK